VQRVGEHKERTQQSQIMEGATRQLGHWRDRHRIAATRPTTMGPAVTARFLTVAGLGRVLKRREKADRPFPLDKRSAGGEDRSHRIAGFSQSDADCDSIRGHHDRFVSPRRQLACDSSRDAGFRRQRWRDPDSNRGHHDFQSWA
jgi:hypothetical protein